MVKKAAAVPIVVVTVAAGAGTIVVATGVAAADTAEDSKCAVLKVPLR
ncbi:hypothetical protein [Candidatus Deferrimicrobium sp.]|nr:hypothetical protein [Candidatus Deferrimicrobium sp.]